MPFYKFVSINKNFPNSFVKGLDLYRFHSLEKFKIVQYKKEVPSKRKEKKHNNIIYMQDIDCYKFVL
jgi:hypothetical protein